MLFLSRRLSANHPLGMGLLLSALLVSTSPIAAGGKADTKLPTAPAIPGFARFYHDADANAVKGGQLLLGELNCISCHASGNASDASLARKAAPILDSVGSRVKRSYLQQFIVDPQATKPGTTMPNLFAGIDEKEKQARAEALAHYFASTGTPAQDRADKKGVTLGRDLYHKVGCVTCHGTRDAKGDQDKIFPTSIPLSNLKAKYTLASIKSFLENPHHARPSGRMPGLLTGKEAADVANFLMQGTAPFAANTNMHYSYYEGSWKNLPDFAKLKPIATGEARDFELTVTRRANDCGLKFDGFLKIEQEGEYTFYLTSDDGSKLWIDGKVVVNNDGIHPPTTKSGKTKLAKGMHKLTLGVFNGGGGFELSAEVVGPGVGRQPLGPQVALTEKPAPIVAEKPDPDNGPVQPELVAKGKELFSSMGCANCHPMQKEKPQAGTAPALAKLKAEGGCLEAAPKKGVPFYALSNLQRTALSTAIKAPAPDKLDAKEIVARTMTTFNCYACHDRGKIGGVEEDLNKFFQTVQPEMGDEGRLPPSLNGVGGKMNPEYLKKILDQGSHDRPYMHTRMPKFGDANVGHLVKLYGELDTPAKLPKVDLKAPPAKIKAEARNMVGKSFGCVKCHTFAGNKAEGVQGIDMAIMTARLKKEWFHNYMQDPSKVRPGTRMPAPFSDGKTLLKNVLDGTAEGQIEAMWVYLADGKLATPPFSSNKPSIPLIPDKEAIIYRNFIQGAGPRGIAVGYPERAHVAFDANEIRLAMIWQGAFMDARRHWTDRGVGFEPPMGDNIVTLPPGPSLFILAKPDEPWPTKPAKELGYKFLGYRLGDDQRPTFLYSFNDIKVEDFPNAIETKASPSIRRTLAITTENPIDKLYYRAAVADKIELIEAGVYSVNNVRMRIESGAMPEIRTSGKKMELLVPIRFQGNSAKIVQEYVW